MALGKFRLREMNNWPDEDKELNQESIVQRATHQSLCRVLNQLIKHFNFIYHEGIESLVVSHSQEGKNLQWKHLNWRFPGEAEFKWVTTTLKQQEELLQHEYREGKYTFLHELLVRLLRHLWKYIKMSNFTSMESPSIYHREERIPFPWQIEGRERETLQQHVKKLVHLLKIAMPGCSTQDSQHTRGNEEHILRKFSSCYTNQEL